MAPFQPIHAIIGHVPCLRVINRKYGFKLNFAHLLIMFVIKSFNEAGVKCGLMHVEEYCILNCKRKSRRNIGDIFTYLQSIGLIHSRKRGSNRSLLGLSLTVSGLQVFASFEKLVSSYKVKGLPDGV